MANIHGAIGVCEKRIRGKWAEMEQNRAALEALCSPREGAAEAVPAVEEAEQVKALLERNRQLLEEIGRQYLALLGLRHR